MKSGHAAKRKSEIMAMTEKHQHSVIATWICRISLTGLRQDDSLQLPSSKSTTILGLRVPNGIDWSTLGARSSILTTYDTTRNMATACRGRMRALLTGIRNRNRQIEALENIYLLAK